MGITVDQIHEGAVRRLRYHYDALRKLWDENPWRNRIEWDMHAWAFARTAVTSDEIAFLISEIGRAFEEAIIDLDAEHERVCAEWPDENIVDRRLGLEVIELVLRAHRLLSGGNNDQGSNIDATWDAWNMLDEWNPRGGQEAILYLDDELYAELRGPCGLDPESWVGVRERLDRDVPDELIERALKR